MWLVLRGGASASDILTADEAACLARLSMEGGGWWICDNPTSQTTLRFVKARVAAPLHGVVPHSRARRVTAESPESTEAAWLFAHAPPARPPHRRAGARG